MMAEAFSRLGPISPISDYRYVGMGSIYFRDFLLFHRRLGIEKMVTIENLHARERVEFNRPLASITIEMGDAAEVLPRLAVDESPHIIWLDYESRITPAILETLTDCAYRCAPGSILAVSVNVERIVEREQWESWRASFADFPAIEMPRFEKEWQRLAYLQVIRSIEKGVASRNQIPADFNQFLHFGYSDGSPMLTVGGILLGPEQDRAWNDCRMGELYFIRTGEDAFRIEVPQLTKKEMQHLLAELPEAHGHLTDASNSLQVPIADAQRLARSYRYAPVYLEAEEL